jgi:hypothetical protein
MKVCLWAGVLLRCRVGTPYYVAPEVLRQSYSFPADVWSAGVTAYQLLTGRFPWHADPEWVEEQVRYSAAVVTLLHCHVCHVSVCVQVKLGLKWVEEQVHYTAGIMLSCRCVMGGGAGALHCWHHAVMPLRNGWRSRCITLLVSCCHAVA